MKTNSYKKFTTKECHYCDYYICRKNKRCSVYKKFVKTYKKNRNKGVRDEIQEGRIV